MNSVLGKLIQKEFGRNKYKIYCNKMDRKECMDIFCDIYLELNRIPDEKLSDRLVNLLRTVQLSVKISQVFLPVTVGFAAAVLILSVMPFMLEVKVAGIGVMTLFYFYKVAEYIRNRYCDRDVRLVLIYKTALFHMLSDEGR